MRIFLSVIITLIILALFSIFFIYSGWYNVSAMNEETGITKWVLNTTMDRSVEYHSKDIKVPSLNDPSMLKEGFEHYNEMCVSCHSAPGKEETELSKGLNPPAPNLAKSAKEMSPQKLFWITKNGIKMTGMPAWGKTHSDEKIWAMVAFMKKLPSITDTEYEKLEKESLPDDEENDGHSHSH